MESLITKTAPTEFFMTPTDPAVPVALPTRGTPHSAGLDLQAIQPLTLLPGQRGLVKTGLNIALPTGYEAQIRPRSGLALHHGVTVLNAPGTIDADYRGEVMVLLINHGQEPFNIQPGDRIAQMVIAPVAMFAPVLVDTLPPTTSRGEGGYGSTGL